MKKKNIETWKNAVTSVALLVLPLAGCSAATTDEPADTDQAKVTDGLEACACGGRIDGWLPWLASDYRARWSALRPEAKRELCYSFIEDPDASMSASWDVNALAFAECDSGKTRVPGTTCGVDACRGSVTVGDGCFTAGAVNYFYWGVIMESCHSEFRSEPRLGASAAEAAVAAYRCLRHGCGGIPDRVAWTRSGFTYAATGQLLVPSRDGLFGGRWPSAQPEQGLCSDRLGDAPPLHYVARFGGAQPRDFIVGGEYRGEHLADPGACPSSPRW